MTDDDFADLEPLIVKTFEAWKQARCDDKELLELLDKHRRLCAEQLLNWPHPGDGSSHAIAVDQFRFQLSRLTSAGLTGDEVLASYGIEPSVRIQAFAEMLAKGRAPL